MNVLTTSNLLCQWPAAMADESEEEDSGVSTIPIPCPRGTIAAASSSGFWSAVGKRVILIVVMGINAFIAALATQVYKIYTKRWREGGGSDIPVINSSPGDTTSNPSGTPGGGSGGRPVSPDFINRYRD